ncbi:MAG: bifunctional folylpolyglutamate synthase/dihydrofolate synthase [Oscillospiraceae bacterium]|nr:bifunctional folylpolyglutamate synthase/dihydrofolate synthase [Oscillospiraceae bacterium]
MTVDQIVEYLDTFKLEGRDLSPRRTQRFLKKLGNPEKKLKFVHVTGTNGKGSTCAYVASIMRKAGYRVGSFVSPHIVKFNERLQCNGEYITDEELIKLVEDARPILDTTDDPPTQFEIVVGLAMMFYVEKECDIVVLEVGMGGDTDATNVIDTPEVAIIATIGFDHIAALGPELTDIARAKAGIIKQGGDAAIYGSTKEVEELFESICKERGAKLHKADFSRISNQVESIDGLKFSLEPYGEVTTALLGSYQSKNATLAITAIEILREKGFTVADEDIISGLRDVNWPGRFEVIGRNPVFILDGAHNAEAVEVTADSLKRYFGDDKIVFIIGAMNNKDVDTMVSLIAPMAKAFINARPDYERAMESELMEEKLSIYDAPVYTIDDFEQAVTQAINLAGNEGVVCVIGSLHFSTDLRTAYNSIIH